MTTACEQSIMPRMDERPGWIELLFKRGHGRTTFKTVFLLELDKRHIVRECDTVSNGRQALRDAALEVLEVERSSEMVQALAYLLVVGSPEDLGAVQPLITHHNESIRNAAKAVAFELARMDRLD